MSEKIRMTSNRILIDPKRNSELTHGIFTGRPTTTFTQHSGKDEQICTGKVLSIGPGKEHNKTGAILPTGVKIGQYVVFSDTCHRKAGTENKDLIVIRSDDVMVVSNEPFNHAEVLY